MAGPRFLTAMDISRSASSDSHLHGLRWLPILDRVFPRGCQASAGCAARRTGRGVPGHIEFHLCVPCATLQLFQFARQRERRRRREQARPRYPRPSFVRLKSSTSSMQALHARAAPDQPGCSGGHLRVIVELREVMRGHLDGSAGDCACRARAYRGELP